MSEIVLTALEQKAKAACRVISTDYDEEIHDLVDAALIDLTCGGAYQPSQTDALVIRAVCTYCKANLGNPENYDRLKASYDEQKAQMGTATGYTNWSAS